MMIVISQTHTHTSRHIIEWSVNDCRKCKALRGISMNRLINVVWSFTAINMQYAFVSNLSSSDSLIYHRWGSASQSQQGGSINLSRGHRVIFFTNMFTSTFKVRVDELHVYLLRASAMIAVHYAIHVTHVHQLVDNLHACHVDKRERVKSIHDERSVHLCVSIRVYVRMYIHRISMTCNIDSRWARSGYLSK